MDRRGEARQSRYGLLRPGSAWRVGGGEVRLGRVRRDAVRQAVMARSGEVCWGQECFGMVRQSLARQGLDWFGKAVVVSRVRDR